MLQPRQLHRLMSFSPKLAAYSKRPSMQYRCNSSKGVPKIDDSIEPKAILKTLLENKYFAQAYSPKHRKKKWALLLLATGTTGLCLFAFGPELKGGFSRHTAEVASKSLQDESFQLQTQQLASDIVQTILNDPKILNETSRFLQQLLVMEQTQTSLLRLVKIVLGDPQTLAEVTKLTKQLLYRMLEDPATLHQLIEILKRTVLDQETRAALLSVLASLLADAQVKKQVGDMLADVFAQEYVKNSVTNTLQDSVHSILQDAHVQNHAKEFVATVMQDQTIQTEGGDALWHTFWYSVTPRWLGWIKRPRTDSPVGDDKSIALVPEQQVDTEINENSSE